MAKQAHHEGLMSCRTCGQLVRQAVPRRELCCPRCHAALHARKPASLQRCWAFLLAAVICYIPANLLPMMQTSTLFGTQQDTILSGVVYLWNVGSWSLALVVFVASIVVPLLKIIGLLVLLLSIHFHWRWAPLQRTRLYRLLDVVGPWSMLDIYVLGMLTALVNFRSLATVVAGPAALAFALVVVLTMLAVIAFDPRLIWDFEKDISHD